MRTTVTIDDNLLRLAKERAHAERKTLGDLVENALQDYLTRPRRSAASDLPVFRGGTGMRPGIDPTSNRSMYDAMDDDRREGEAFTP